MKNKKKVHFVEKRKIYENSAYLTKCKKTLGSFYLLRLISLRVFRGFLFVHLEHNAVKCKKKLQERCRCTPCHSEPKDFSLLTFHGLESIFLPPASPFCPLPTHTCAQALQEGGKFILHKQFALWPLFERVNQVANSDVDTCPFGTGMKTATHFLETIKHPVREQQLSINCNLGKT